MVVESPPIDKRHLKEIESKLLEKLVYYTKQPNLIHSDRVKALVAAFLKMHESTLLQLNQVPQKNFLAFLDMLNMQFLSPRAAESLLQFTIAEGNQMSAWVPKFTQVIYEPTDQDPIIFETQNPLNVWQHKILSDNIINSTTIEIEFNKDISEVPLRLWCQIQKFFSIDFSLHTSLRWRYIVLEKKNPKNFEVKEIEIQQDLTRNLSQDGFVDFLTPKVEMKGVDLDPEKFRFIIEVTGNNFDRIFHKNKLQVFTNVVVAKQAVSVESEILGSSHGEKKLKLSSIYKPVLPGEKLYVQENNMTVQDQKKWISQYGVDAVIEHFDALGKRAEIWVLWIEVENFFSSKQDDRHYILDRNSGLVEFGNGERGMIPPIEELGIKMTYQFGGGARGNILPHQIDKIRTTIPYIEGVTNITAGEGGADRESLVDFKTRAPRSIKTRNRCVTVTDYEWLAQEASPNVARSKCIESKVIDKDTCSNVTVIIIPKSRDEKPRPSSELIAAVKKYLFEKMAVNLFALRKVDVIGPSYMDCRIKITLSIRDLFESLKIRKQVEKMLHQYIHPISGGSQKRGWPFGRNIPISEIYHLLEKIPGVDHVEKVIFTPVMQIYSMQLQKNQPAFLNLPKRTLVTFEKGKIKLLLEEALLPYVKNSRASVNFVLTGFRQSDFIQIQSSSPNPSIHKVLVVKSIEHSMTHDTLICDTFDGNWTNFQQFMGATVKRVNFRGELAKEEVTSYVTGTIERVQGESVYKIPVARPSTSKSTEVVVGEKDAPRLKGDIAWIKNYAASQAQKQPFFADQKIYLGEFNFAYFNEIELQLNTRQHKLNKSAAL